METFGQVACSARTPARSGWWRPSVRSRARSGDRHDHICFGTGTAARQKWNRGVGLGSTPSLEGDGVTGGWCRNPSVSRRGKMETFGQIACSVRRLPIHFMVGTGGTIRMVETFGQVACSVRRPARSYLFRYGHSRTIKKGECGDLRSGRVLGEDAGTIRMRAQVARSG